VIDFTRFHRKFVPNERFVSGSFYESISTAQFKDKASGKEMKAPLLRLALLKAEYSCPPQKVVQRECKFITKSDIEGLTRKSIEQAFAAEDILTKCREIVLGLGECIREEDRVKLFGRLDTNIARVLLKKQQQSALQFDSLGAAANAFIGELCSLVPTAKVENPWASIAVTPPASSGPQLPVSDDMQSFTCAGKFMPGDGVSLVRAAGFVIGGAVVHKSNKTKQFVIDSSTDRVNLSSVDVPSMHVDCKDFLSHWCKHDEEDFPFDHAHQARQHDPYLLASSKGMIARALRMFTESMAVPAVRVQAKPTKRVLALKSYDVGACTLVPETMGISVVTAGQSAPATGIEVFVTAGHADAKFYLLPPAMSTDSSKTGLVAPLWVVRATQDPGEATMQWCNRTVSMQVKILPMHGKAQTDEITIPVMSNLKPLQIGDELIILKLGHGDAAKPSAASSEPKDKAPAKAPPKQGQAKRQRTA